MIQIRSITMFMVTIAIVGAIGTGGLLLQNANAAATVQKTTCTGPPGSTSEGHKVFTPSGHDILSCHFKTSSPPPFTNKCDRTISSSCGDTCTIKNTPTGNVKATKFHGEINSAGRINLHCMS